MCVSPKKARRSIYRDKANRHIFWLDTKPSRNPAIPPIPILAQEIVEDLKAALDPFPEVGADLNGDVLTEKIKIVER